MELTRNVIAVLEGIKSDHREKRWIWWYGSNKGSRALEPDLDGRLAELVQGRAGYRQVGIFDSLQS